MSPTIEKSVQVISPVCPKRMHDGVPILVPEMENDWENKVVLNPAAVLIESGDELTALFSSWRLNTGQQSQLNDAGGACVLIYRAQGETLEKRTSGERMQSPSFLGLAILTPDLKLVHRLNSPILKPDSPWHNLGVEDPRCTKVGDTYYLYYTGYASENLSGKKPGQAAQTQARICLATTSDFISWDQHGPVAGDINSVANKNAALFPDPVNSSWLLFHRPMSGPGAMAIHTASAGDPAGPWESTGVFMESLDYPEMRRSWIGAGAPPVPTGDGRFVMIYHQGHYLRLDGTRLYTLAAALIDFRSIDPVQGRIEPLMIPTGAIERVGDLQLGVNNVLFTCGNYLWGDDLIVPYAAADSRIFGAKINFVRLIEALDTTISN